MSHTAGPLLVVAGPGSGKTRVLTERVRRLLTAENGHFHVLALTFTNKAAKEMKDRLLGLGDARRRASIGTMHSFCVDLLADRGDPVGVTAVPQIFERIDDRMKVLHRAALTDPELRPAIKRYNNARERDDQLKKWLKGIEWIKAHPITCSTFANPLDQRLLEAYNSQLRACGAYDFDDLLLLTCRLLKDNPPIADFYRRLYGFICIDEAQDLNEAQYALITTLCGDDFRDVMMVGDPKQSIFGFNTSNPEFMNQFRDEFGASVIELTQNFRSSRAVVALAQGLEPAYTIDEQLPVQGMVEVIVGDDEADEAAKVVDTLEYLLRVGHEDVEGGIRESQCAVLGRTRYHLLAIEHELSARGIPYYRRLGSNHEYRSAIMEDFHLALRVTSNPKDRLHLTDLVKRWGLTLPPDTSLSSGTDVTVFLETLADRIRQPRVQTVVDALIAIARQTQRFDVMPGVTTVRTYSDGLTDETRNEINEDAAVLEQEWDYYLRSTASTHTIAGFMSSLALGETQQATQDGVALLTVHSAKGLEFDVVFLACMAEGAFPYYRAKSHAERAEEGRNAFVAVTRSKRLLYLSYPMRRMTRGGSMQMEPSSYLVALGLSGRQ